MIEIVDTIERWKAANDEIGVAPEHGQSRCPYRRQLCRCGSDIAQLMILQSAHHDQRHVEIAVAPTEASVRETSSQIYAENPCVEPLRDCRSQLARECIGGFSSEVVRIEGHLIWAGLRVWYS